MEINFDSQEIMVYREVSHQLRRIQESAECVVPDTDADIEKIVSVQSTAILKSKDLTSRGLLISGELSASVIYIGDGDAGISNVRLRKPFTMEFEAEGLESETMAQIALRIQGTDVRMVNPRKVSVMFETEGELSCYGTEKLCVDAALPENTPGLYAKTETRDIALLNAVCEKSIALNEQFPLQTEGNGTQRLMTENAAIQISDSQLLGSKMIIKGDVEISACTLREEGDVPTFYTFSAPFSQIIDVGVENVQCSRVRPEITGSYFDLIDTINGGKALDVELHAVLQLVCCESREIRCITDAYSNLMPAELISVRQETSLDPAVRMIRMSTREQIALTEPCRELIHVFSTLTRVGAEDGRLSAALVLDFLYRSEENRLSVCRRTLSLSEDTEEKQMQIVHAGEPELDVRLNGDSVDCTVNITFECTDRQLESFTAVQGILLDEEKAYSQASLPTLTLIRREGESLWGLAKKYHSSVEKIRELNEDAENSTRMLLIPKCV